MGKGDTQRLLIDRVVGEARKEHLDARSAFRLWDEPAVRWDEHRDIDPDAMARVFAQGRRDAHPFWRLVLAVGRVNLAGEPTDEHLLAPHLSAVARATRTVALWVQNGWESLVARGCTTAPDRFKLEVGTVADRMVGDLAHVRQAIAACGMIGRYPSVRRAADGERLERADIVARECVHVAARAADYADQALRSVTEAGFVRVHHLGDATRRLLNAGRLEYVRARYNPHPMLAPVGPLPFVLNGWIEGESPAVVQAGLARTFALSRVTEFPDEPAVLNGVLADWCEEHGEGSQKSPAVVTDLRGAINSAHCPSCVLAEYWSLRGGVRFSPLPEGPGW